MSGDTWRRDRRIAKRKIWDREYFWGSQSFYLQSKKALGHV